MFRHVIVFVLPCLISCAVISSSETGNENSRKARLLSGGGDDGNVKFAAKLMGDCLHREYSEMADCLGVKAIMAVDRAARMSTVPLLPGISFVADHEVLQQRTGRTLMTEEEIENSISAEPNEKGAKLADMLFDSMARFLESHTLQFRLPKSSSMEMQRAFDEGKRVIYGLKKSEMKEKKN